MKRVLIWDIPVRLFHWLLAGSFLGAFVIANTVDDESGLFVAHMWLGGVAAFMVLLRLVWGFVGSRHARFRSFDLRPAALAGYLRGALSGKGERRAGHNPANALAAIAMFALVLGLAVTGVGMSTGSEAAEELHEMLAFAMVALVALHVAGVALHTVRHRDNIALGMVDGRKEADPAAAIPKAHALVGLVFVGLTGLWAGGLYDGYDPATHTVTIPLIGKTVQLGEGEEHEEHGEHGEHGEHEEHEEHDD